MRRFISTKADDLIIALGGGIAFIIAFFAILFIALFAAASAILLKSIKKEVRLWKRKKRSRK